MCGAHPFTVFMVLFVFNVGYITIAFPSTLYFYLAICVSFSLFSHHQYRIPSLYRPLSFSLHALKYSSDMHNFLQRDTINSQHLNFKWNSIFTIIQQTVKQGGESNNSHARALAHVERKQESERDKTRKSSDTISMQNEINIKLESFNHLQWFSPADPRVFVLHIHIYIKHQLWWFPIDNQKFVYTFYYSVFIGNTNTKR